MVLGDGQFVRSWLGALVDFLHRYAAPTGARGSVLMMAGGLLVLSFLFTAFLFRSNIVGDLAPVANARRPLPRARLPGEPAPSARVGVVAEPVTFQDARRLGHELSSGFDDAFHAMAELGVEARVIHSLAGRKLVRLYRCASCSTHAPPIGCEHERGLLAGAFERLSGELCKVEEVACAMQGAAFCEFEVRHAPLRRIRSTKPRSVTAR
jgi:predicted hydrocarbon binding protein